MRFTNNARNRSAFQVRYVIVLLLFVYRFSLIDCSKRFGVVPRARWGAHPPLSPPEKLEHPVQFVIVLHTHLPEACATVRDCVEAMQWMQDLHQIGNEWGDIGYNFAIGGDSIVYEGRGWNAVGAHSPGYNNRSVGIGLIGDWGAQTPPRRPMNALRKLIRYGVVTGKIKRNYTLRGGAGERLMEQLRTWPQFSEGDENEVDAS